jgi:hypothetical protein
VTNPVAQQLVPKAAALNCPSCGASIEMHAQGWAVSVVCASCGAQLDATDPNLTVLQYGERVTLKPRIPLGTRGTWKGAPWEVIGCQVVTISVEGVNYSWTEYVCFNPYRGFLYLSEYDGHWNVIEKLRWQPRGGFVDGQSTLTYGGTTYKHFQSAVATTTAALGEFPWELRVGDSITSHDYVAPPSLLSVEVSGGEVTISQGAYTPPDAIAKAFGLPSLMQPIGVFANQPNPHVDLPKRMGERFMLALLVFVAMLIGNVTFAANEQVFSQSYSYDRGVGESGAFVTAPFELTGRSSGVAIDVNAALDNDWVFFTLSLINERTGETREVTRQLEYYSGVDSDGSWSEGDRSETVRLSSVPAGRYFLRVEPEGGEIGKQRVGYTLQVRRDVPHFGFYAVAFLALLTPMLFSLFPTAAFENRRWAESDHPIGGTTSSDEDE